MPHSGTRGGSLTRLLEQEFPPDVSLRIDIPPTAYDPYRRASFPIYEGIARPSHLENPVIPPYPYNPTPAHLPVVRPYLSDHSEKKCCVVILLVFYSAVILMTHYPVSLQETSVFSVTFTAIPIINQDVRELQRRLVYHIFLPNQSYLSVKLYLKEVTITLFLCYCIYISILLVHNGRSPSDNELAPQSCSYGFVPNEKTRSCYKFLSVKVDFQNAFEACFHRDSLLVSLKDEEENTFVANLVKANSESDSEATDSNDVWIGLVNFENHWRWMYPTSSKYMNWAPEMPDKNPKNVVAKMRIGKKNEWINVNPSNTVDKARVVCKKPMGV